MSKFRYGTVAIRSILFLPHSPPIEIYWMQMFPRIFDRSMTMK